VALYARHVSTPKDVLLLAGIFATSGVVHLAKPEVYEPLMPDVVPAHREVILASGVAELGLAAGLLLPRTRRAAGWGSVALLLGVFPGNLKMADDARRSRSTKFKALAYGRLPLQAPMVRIALKAARA
jgi:uncharacterized membrane protein